MRCPDCKSPVYSYDENKPDILKDTEKVQSVEEAINENESRFYSALTITEQMIYRTGAKFGAQWQQSQSGLVNKERVVEIIEAVIKRASERIELKVVDGPTGIKLFTKDHYGKFAQIDNSKILSTPYSDLLPNT
jgi:hypothetical protein